MDSSLKQNTKFYKPIVLKNLFANYAVEHRKFPILNKDRHDNVSNMFDITRRFQADKKINNALCEYLKINKLNKVLGRYRTIGNSLGFHTDGHEIVDENHIPDKTRINECKGKLNFLVNSITNENYLIFLNYFLDENVSWSVIDRGKFLKGGTTEPCKAIKTNLPLENKKIITEILLINENIKKLHAETYCLVSQEFQSTLSYSANDGLLFNPTQYHASGEILTGKDVLRNFIEFYIY